MSWPIIEQIRDNRTGALIPDKVAGLLGLPLGDFARLLDADPDTIEREPGSPRFQERLHEVVRVVARAASLTADPADIAAAVRWFRFERIAAFGGRTAEELVRDGRSAAVIRHLETLAEGGYG